MSWHAGSVRPLSLSVGEEGGAIVISMAALRAHVENGCIIVDDPTDWPDGPALQLMPVNEGADAFADMDPEERAALEAAIEEGYEDFEKGDVIDRIEFAESLVARR